MTDYVYYIRTDSTSGGDGTEDRTDGPTRAFPTFTEAEATVERDNTAAGDTVTFNARSGTYNEGVIIDGWTLSATDNCTWKALSGHEHAGVIGGGVILDISTDWVVTVYPQDSYHVFEDLELRNGGTTSQSHACRVNVIGVIDNIFRRCIFKTTNSPVLFCNGTGLLFESCLFYGASSGDGVNLGGYVSNTFRNSTFADNSGKGVEISSSGSQVSNFHNSVAYNNSGGDFTSNDIGGSYNASSDSTEPGTNPITTDIVSGDFTDAAANDYSISGTGSTLYDSGSAANQAALDIAGQPFTTNDVGCYAFSGGAPGQSGSVTDSASLSDVITGLAHKIGQIADSATLTDTITGTVTAGESGTVSDQATLTDVIDALMSHIGVAGSTAATADTIQGVAHYLVDIADNASFTDTIEGSTALSDAIEDAATLSDLISALQGYVGSISESVTVSDVIDGVLGNQIAYVNETVVMSSSVTGIASYIGNISDHAGMADLIMVLSDDEGEDQDRVVEDVVVDTINDTDSRVEILKDRKVYRRDR